MKQSVNRKLYTLLILVVVLGLLNTVGVIKIVPILFIYYLFYKWVFPLYKTNNIQYFWVTLFLSYNLLLILRCCFFDSNYGVLGNWFLSLLGNAQVGIPVLLMPMLVCIANDKSFATAFVRVCKGLIYVNICVASLCIMNVNVPYANALSMTAVFLVIPYYLRIKRSLIWIAIFLVSYRDIVDGERSMLIALVLTFGLTVMLTYLHHLRKMYIRTIIYGMTSITIFLLVFNLYAQVDFFTWLIESYGNYDVVGDNTRSFLFFEIIEDFNINKAWIFGKGILGTYFSQVMFDARNRGDSVDNMSRLITECGWLLLLLKGGLVNVCLYAMTQISIMHTAFKKNNGFLDVCIIILAVHFMIMFVSNSIYFDLPNVMYWLVAGICLTKNKTF